MNLTTAESTDLVRVEAADQTWQSHNEAHIGAALRLLRLKLEALAAANRDKTGEDPERPRGRRSFFGGWSEPVDAVSARPGPSCAEIDGAAARLRNAEKADPPSALSILSERFALSRFERDVLLLCAAPALDTRIGSLCAAAQGNLDRAYPTFALAISLFEDAAWDALSPLRPLRYWHFIEVGGTDLETLTTAPLRVDERILHFLKGLNYLDTRISALVEPMEVTSAETLPPSQQHVLETTLKVIGQNAADGLVQAQVVGPDPIAVKMVAQQAAQARNLTLFRLPVSMLQREGAEIERIARLWHREQLLMPLALFLDAHDQDFDGDVPAVAAGALERFLALSGGVFIIAGRTSVASLAQTAPTIEVRRPSPPEQAGIWVGALGSGDDELAETLAAQFSLNAPTIRRIAQTHADSGEDALWQACLAATGQRMNQLAERLEPLARWEDIVLPETETALLRQISRQVALRSKVYDAWGFRKRMNRGLGISTLFAGGSGTGKTMAAEVLANALRLHLFRIDLSTVVSKYVGETEKNLRRLFDAAEDGGAILFFDEADALFGKRSEVRDSHDRYANIEVSYLLQRIESYRGLAILATNMRGALDDAFLRRLRFVVNFPYPGPTDRKRIWQRAWPEEVRRGALDYDRLARLNLAGGNIATVALNAAFLAAEAGSPVTMPLVLDAARTEFAKLERAVNEADFRWSAVDVEKLEKATA